MIKIHSLTLVVVIFSILIISVIADSFNDLETLEGSQRNRLSGVGNTSTTGNNTFTGNNAFTGNLVSTNGIDGTVTNYLSMIDLYATQAADNNWLNLRNTSGVSIGRLRMGAGNGIQLTSSAGGLGADIAMDDTSGTIAFMAGAYVASASTYTVGSAVTETHNGINNFASNVVLGASAFHTITVNASTITAPNTLNFNAGTMFVTNGGVAINTNSIATTESFIVQSTAANQVGMVIRGAPGQSVDLLQLRSSPNTLQMAFTTNGGIRVISGNASSTLASSGVNFINSGGTVAVNNNTASVDSSLTLNGGTGARSYVVITSDGFWASKGFKINKVNTTTNYQLSVRDNFVSFKPNQSGTTITGTLAAASLFVTNGFCVAIKDAQQSANVTNIVIMPNGSDTIDRATSKTISAAGGSFNLIYDGIGNNWETY